MKNLFKKLFKKRQRQKIIVYKYGKIYKFNNFDRAVALMIST